MKYSAYHKLSRFIFDTIFCFDNACRVNKISDKILKSLMAYEFFCTLCSKHVYKINSENVN